jgi:C1A family cysteine protease
MARQRIEDVPEFAPHVTALKALGYHSKEEVLGVARAAAPDLLRYLGSNAANAALLAQLAPPEMAAAPAAVHALRPLGVVLDQIPPPQFAFSLPAAAAAAAPLPPSADLFAELPAPLDQGERSTCVAFAGLAVVEQAATRAGNYQPMSEQFLYWDCKQNDGIPTTPGTYVAVAFRVLASDGCCLDASWPYAPTLTASEDQGPPPPAAQPEAGTYQIGNFNSLPPTSVDDIRREIAAGHCVAFSIPVFNSWYNGNTVVESTGDITNPLPGEGVVGGHAMAIIGYEDSPEEGLGGGRFLIRNSWANWGSASRHGAGYGTIPYSYIDRFGREAYSLG